MDYYLCDSDCLYFGIDFYDFNAIYWKSYGLDFASDLVVVITLFSLVLHPANTWL